MSVEVKENNTENLNYSEPNVISSSEPSFISSSEPNVISSSEPSITSNITSKITSNTTSKTAFISIGFISLILFIYKTIKTEEKHVFEIILNFLASCCCPPCYIVYALVSINS